MAGYTNGGMPAEYIYINCTIEQIMEMFNRIKK